MSKKWTRRSALALIGSGAGLLTWGTGGFTDVTADRLVNIDTTADDSDTDDPLLGITTHDYDYNEDDWVVFETERPPIVTLTNNTESQFDEINVEVPDNDHVQIVSEPDSLGVGKSGKVTAKVTKLGSDCTREDIDVDLKITASSTAPSSAPEITASRSVSLSCVNCINFQDSETETPSGFIADIGDKYGSRGGSDLDWTVDYGWERDQTGEARNYNGYDISVADKTHNHFEIIDGPHPNRFNNSIDPNWKIDLPNGWYNVTMHCRDPKYDNQEYSFDVAGGAETVQLRDNKFDNADETRPEHAETYSFPLKVDGSRLRITPPDGTYNPKISWLRFESREDEPKPTVDISAEGFSNKRGISQNQDYYFKITNNHNAPIDLTAVRVDFARTVYGGEYIEPDLFGRTYGGNYEMEISVGEDLSFNGGTSDNADYRDALRNQWYDDIGEKAALEATPRGGQLAADEEAELGLFGFRRQTQWGTDLVDMKGADVHITLWYKKEGDDTEYRTTSAVFSSET